MKKDYRTWYMRYFDEYDNVVRNLPTNGTLILDIAHWKWVDIYCLREQLWAEREGLA